MNTAINYIEENLTDLLNMEDIARIANCSAFHFQRMFSYMAEIPLSEYIRRRKMTRAAFDLQNTDEKIIDIALKYGYDSPTAFNRAFQNVHGLAPSMARHQGITLKSYSPIRFLLSIKGDEEMNYRIEKKEAFKIIGAKAHYEINVEENFKEVPLFWQKTAQSGVIPSIMSCNNQEPKGLLGVSTCMNGKDFDYFIAVASDLETPEHFDDFIVPAGTWAIFESIGPMPEALQQLQKRIVTEWLPSSGYEYANAPDIEVYFEGDQFAADYRCEAWLPIVKK